MKGGTLVRTRTLPIDAHVRRLRRKSADAMPGRRARRSAAPIPPAAIVRNAGHFNEPTRPAATAPSDGLISDPALPQVEIARNVLLSSAVALRHEVVMTASKDRTSAGAPRLQVDLATIVAAIVRRADLFNVPMTNAVPQAAEIVRIAGPPGAVRHLRPAMGNAVEPARVADALRRVVAQAWVAVQA
jgi:hypothetical protein